MDDPYNARPKPKRSHKDEPETSRQKPRPSVPQIGDIFNNFPQPGSVRKFKSEPLDDDAWKDMRAKDNAAAMANKKGKDSANPGRPRSHNSLRNQDSGENATEEPDSARCRDSKSKSVVDLTEDVDEPIKSPVQHQTIATPTKPTSSPPRPLNIIQIQYMDKLEIPADILAQAKHIYARENIPFPPSLKLWAHLKHFVANQPSSFLKPQLVAMMQAHIFHKSTQQDHVTDRAASQNNLAPQQSSQTPIATNQGPPVNNPLNGMREIKVEAEVQEQQQRARPLQAPLNTAVQNVQTKPGPLFPIAASAVQNAPAPNVIAPDQYADSLLENLTRPMFLMQDILPPDVHERHPRLVEIWNERLLSIPTNVHEHMNLLDTIVSVLARYDLQTRSTIEAFLDLESVNHFFFVFKARDKNMHSWSIEREANIVTIGIERKNRAIRKLNENEIETCSSGQVDLQIQYEIRYPSVKSKRASKRKAKSTESVGDSPESPQSKPHPLYRLVNSTLLPTVPDLASFLHETPPTRGADEHAHISHPLQSSLLDPANENSAYRHALSIFARYIQHTAFTARAIDAEIQVVWGRKLRFDTTLGRVRPVWDYALKGAKTQRAKRERGEYNRPTGPKNGAGDEDVFAEPKKYNVKEADDTKEAKDGGKSDKAGESARRISNELAGNGVATGTGGAALGRSVSEELRNSNNEHVEQNDNADAQHIANVGVSEDAQPPRKKVKREAGESDDEYSDSEHYSS